MPGKNAAEIYQVQPYYNRFNQKCNMTCQVFWNEEARGWSEAMKSNLERLLAKQAPGYQLEDWAFNKGASGNLANTSFQVIESFREGNYWLPLSSLPSTPSIFPHVAYTPQVKRNGDPGSNSNLITKMANLFGADQVGFCSLDRRWVFSHYWNVEAKQEFSIKFSDEPGYEEIDKPARLEDGTIVIPKGMKYCIVLIHGMDRDGMATAPTLTQLATASLAYSRISYTVVMLAEFIRGLGYHAIPSANDLALNIPLAIDAGLGEVGRHGKLINPVYGPCCRISKIITDLPLNPTEPKLLGVNEFCMHCLKCAESCPVDAISYSNRSFEPINECNQHGVLQWQLDAKKCYQYGASVGTQCGICIRACPFNKPNQGIHRLARWAINNTPWVDPALVWLDNAMNYGSFLKPSEFWDTE